MHKFSFTRCSGNRKTGPIPTTMTERASCPAACPLRNAECYAEQWPLVLHWNKITQKGMEIDDLCNKIRALPRGTMWRHNVAGDLPHVGEHIAWNSVSKLVQANTGRRGFTYTHHSMEIGRNSNAVQEANRLGFTVNASCQSPEEAADIQRRYGVPAVAIVASGETRKTWRTDCGARVTVCPAVTQDDMSCARCGLCANATRKTIVAFPAHGNRRKKLDAKLKGK